MDLKQLFSVSKNLNVLYVEDEDNVRKQYTILLKKIFNSVDVTKDGLEGLNKYQEYFNKKGYYYDLVLTDITMPHMDGIEMCKHILNANQDQQILIISAYNDSEKLQKIMSLGLHYFINKPMNLENIVKVLDKVCSYIVRNKQIKTKLKHMEQTVDDLKVELEKAIHDKKTFEEDIFGLYSLLENYEITSLVDKEGHILEMNYEFEKISDYHKENIIGKKFDSFRDLETSKKIWDAMKETKIFRGEIRNKKAGTGEEYYWTDLIAVPMIKDEEVYAYKFIEEDITEDKVVYDSLHEIIDGEFQESLNYDVKIKDESLQSKMIHANDDKFGL